MQCLRRRCGPAQVQLLVRRRRTEKERSQAELRERVLDWLSNGVAVRPKDLGRFASAFGLTEGQAKHAVDVLYSRELSEEFTTETIKSLDALLADLEMARPYDTLPEDVRPSLIRIQKSLAASKELDDKEFLAPVVNALHRYVDLVEANKRAKIHRNVAYLIGGASLIVGLASLLNTPSTDELGEHVVEALADSSTGDNSSGE